MYFSGNQVAFFGAIDDNGSDTIFSDVVAPFRPGDVIEITVAHKDVKGNGEFKNRDVEIESITVVRDGVRYDIEIDEPMIKAPGGKEQGDSFFTTNDEIELDDPFSEMSGKMVFAADSGFATGETTEIERNSYQDLNDDGDTNDNQESGNGTFNFLTADTMPCFLPGTQILTPDGNRRVEDIRSGDLLITRDFDAMPVQLCYSATVSCRGHLSRNQPILIPSGALGANRPTTDLQISPQHCLAAGLSIGTGPLGTGAGRLLRAKGLVNLPGVRVMRGKSVVTYHMLLMPKHSLINANGVWVESLWPGSWTLEMLPPFVRNDLEVRFPGVSLAPETAYGHPILPVEKVQVTLGTLPELESSSSTADAA